MVPFSYGQARFLEAPLVRQADGELKNTNCKIQTLRAATEARTTDTWWRHKSEKSESLGQCGRQNMLQPYLKLMEWQWIGFSPVFGSGRRPFSISGQCFQNLARVLTSLLAGYLATSIRLFDSARVGCFVSHQTGPFSLEISRITDPSSIQIIFHKLHQEISDKNQRAH